MKCVQPSNVYSNQIRCISPHTISFRKERISIAIDLMLCYRRHIQSREQHIEHSAMLLLSYSSTIPLGGQHRFVICACFFITGCQYFLCLFVLPQEGITSQRYKIITTIIQSSHSQVFTSTNSSGRGQHAAPPLTGHTKCTITKLTEVYNKESTGPASSTAVGYHQPHPSHPSHPEMTAVMVGYHRPQLVHPEVTRYPLHYLMGANSAWR